MRFMEQWEQSLLVEVWLMKMMPAKFIFASQKKFLEMMVDRKISPAQQLLSKNHKLIKNESCTSSSYTQESVVCPRRYLYNFLATHCSRSTKCAIPSLYLVCTQRMLISAAQQYYFPPAFIISYSFSSVFVHMFLLSFFSNEFNGCACANGIALERHSQFLIEISSCLASPRLH